MPASRRAQVRGQHVQARSSFRRRGPTAADFARFRGRSAVALPAYSRSYMKRTFSICAPLLVLFGCASTQPGTSASPAKQATSSTTSSPSMADLEHAGAPGAPLAWADFSPATFARAKAEHKFIVMDGSAEWCHWCHVMEAVTYHDDAVRKILDAHFIPVKVDVDSRPDVEERYSEYGWPATVIFSPDASELGKYRGYIAPEDFVEILNDRRCNRWRQIGGKTRGAGRSGFVRYADHARANSGGARFDGGRRSKRFGIRKKAVGASNRRCRFRVTSRGRSFARSKAMRRSKIT